MTRPCLLAALLGLALAAHGAECRAFRLGAFEALAIQDAPAAIQFPRPEVCSPMTSRPGRPPPPRGRGHDGGRRADAGFARAV